MQNKKILLYSFKDRKSFFLDEFICNNNFKFKFIDEERFLVCEYERKIIVDLNEIFRFENDIYSFIIVRGPVILFLNENEEKKYFCLLSFGKIGFMKMIYSNIFIMFFLKMILNIFLWNIKKHIYLIILIFICCISFKKNVINENIESIKNNYLLQRKIYLGYKNILPFIINKNEEKIEEGQYEMRKDSLEIFLKLQKSNSIKRLNIKKIRTNKLVDKDMEYFLKMNKKLKTKSYEK